MMDDMTQLLEELIAQQQGRLMHTAERVVPGITEEDILQPNDFPELENHPEFRYEEGVLAGMQVVKTAWLAQPKSL